MVETELLHPSSFHLSIPLVPSVTSPLSLEICNPLAEPSDGDLAATKTPALARRPHRTAAPKQDS